jgi:hypothetical protein
MPPLFRLFRRNENQTFECGKQSDSRSIPKVGSLEAADPSKRFAIYNVLTREITYLRADETSPV